MMILWIWIPNTGKKYGDPYPTTQKHGIDRQQVVQGKGQWDGSDGCEEYMMVLVAGIVVVGEGKGWVWWWVGKRRMGECGGGWGRGEWVSVVVGGEEGNGWIEWRDLFIFAEALLLKIWNNFTSMTHSFFRVFFSTVVTHRVSKIPLRQLHKDEKTLRVCPSLDFESLFKIQIYDWTCQAGVRWVRKNRGVKIPWHCLFKQLFRSYSSLMTLSCQKKNYLTLKMSTYKNKIISKSVKKHRM